MPVSAGQSTLQRVKADIAEHDHILKGFRLLVADLCQQFKGGHAGGAIGMAAIGVALWKYVMCYASHTPNYFNRDRFILSNGYKAMTFEQLQSYHSEKVDGLCPGHPEIENEGIEMTTGPLGQGLANSVGLAIATKNLEAHFNRPGYDVISNHTWCMIGDACLQEGVGLEAISLAGHLKLNNLTVIYDNNQITCDGSVDLTNTEDIDAKMRACGWKVMDIEDGSYDIEGIVAALENARSPETKQPTFINVRTVIGLGSAISGTAAAHGAAFGPDDVAAMKKAYGFNPEEHYVIDHRMRAFFSELPVRGEALVKQWEILLKRYRTEYPELGAELTSRVHGDLPDHWQDQIPAGFPDKPTATRASSGMVFGPIAKAAKNFLVGTADLSPSVNMIWPGKVDFQHPDLRTACGINGDYSGRYLHYGIREHAMCAISNGVAAYSPGTFIPVTSSFFMFYLYAAPAVRMGALQHLQVIHAATHDSIGMGEDGPTHQPVEVAALYRAMPHILYIRPGDGEETAGAWITAINAKGTPSIISTSRHAVPQLRQTRRDKVAYGAYVLEEDETASITLLGVGAELSFVLAVAAKLKESHGIAARLVSFPCQRLFDKQSLEYKRATLRRHSVPAVVIEPYAPQGWERYASAGICLSRFGHSLPGKAAYTYFGYDIPTMTERVFQYLERAKADKLLHHEFVEL